MKRKLLITLCIFVVLCLGCSAKAGAEQERPVKIWYQNSNGLVDTYIVKDDDTGVNYVVVVCGANIPNGIAVCPRYNADGTLYTGG